MAIVVGVLFVVTGGVKVLGLRQSLAVRDHLGIAPPLWRLIGVLELAGAAGVLIGLKITALGVLAAIGLTLLMLGAIASRAKVRDSALLITADVVVLALVATTAITLVH
nr:DoxX family protein [Kribbella solani]